MVNRIVGFLGFAALAAALAAAPARAADTEPGVWWEQTIKMDMPGMPMAMPPQVNKVCVAKGGPKEPPRADEGCTVTDVKVAGNKMTWKMECTKPEKMSGDGEMTSLKDSYTGVMNMHSKHGDMTMNLSAKKVGGDCDADAPRKQAVAMKKQVDDLQAQSNKSMAEMCDKAVEEMQLRMFAPPAAICKDPAQAAKICERLSTRPGFLAYRRALRGDPELPKAAQTLCKKDPEEYRAGLCSAAVKETKGEATPKSTLQFLAGSCPEEARTFAVKECAGRSYSGDEGMDDPLRGICVQYAKDELAKTDQSKAPAEEPKKDPKSKAADSAKKALKGLFGK
jgi:hypothetical protein